MFERAHHQRIAHLLLSLDGELLRAKHCYFGGGTAIALRYGEYRESVDVDFLVSDTDGYRDLRQMIHERGNIDPLLRAGLAGFTLEREIRTDQYGIRAMVNVSGVPIKFEIVREARIGLANPGPDDSVCGIPTLTPVDMATSKLLANSDRWNDGSVFSRDIIDLAMMRMPLPALRLAVAKAEMAYGAAVLEDLAKAIARLAERGELLERSMEAMAISVPKAQLWQNICRLKRLLRNG